MVRAVAVYRHLEYIISKSGESADFTTLAVGSGALNLILAAREKRWAWWGRLIFYASDVDALYERAISAGVSPDFSPRDAACSERYFHVTDPDDHEISFAAPLTG
jgi:uncharacterized glyoxalase superfamily protein PhnB